ncbi:MAG: GTP-binding protein, partial [Erysipelotrichaceae bacterium]|nr:GTP-binding protein [Erysipelotrichaceae bacterium]
MANYDANKIRNIVFLGHQSAGKTSLVESLLFVSGAIQTKGEVEKKNTISDYTPEEQKRGASIQTAVIPIYLNDVKVNIIDVPGNDDFIGEYLGVMTVADVAVVV